MGVCRGGDLSVAGGLHQEVGLRESVRRWDRGGVFLCWSRGGVGVTRVWGMWLSGQSVSSM